MTPYRTILRTCRPIYKFGVLVLMAGMILAGLGLVVGMFGKGWVTFLIGIGGAAVGIIIGQVAMVSLTNEMKFLAKSVTAKQAHDLAARHLQAHEDDVADTEVFLGKFIGEMDWQEKQREERNKGSKL